MGGSTGNRLVKANERRGEKQFYKELRKRIKRMKADLLFEEPCPLYEPEYENEEQWKQ